MTSGRNALHRIDAAIAGARTTLKQASDSAASDTRAATDFERRELDIFQQIAQIRLDHLQDDEQNGGALGATDREAEELMAAHDQHMEELEAKRDAAKHDIETLEEKRREAERAHEQAIEKHDKAAAATRARLEEDEAYKDKADAVEEANAMAARAAQKLDVVTADRTEKGAPYEQDPLFVYLRDRKFGTRDYKAFSLFALLDGWVARLIKYRDHKLNYDRLLELPVRLGEHADQLEDLAREAEEALEVMEREALEKDGVGKLRERVGDLAARLESVDASIITAEEYHQTLSDSYSQSAAGEGGPIAEAKSLVSETMRALSVPDLKLLAAETATLEDDRLVDALVRLKRERMELEESRRAAARSLKRHGRTLSELEDIRRKFKSRRFDSPYSEFSGRDLIGALLSEFLRGRLNRDEFWRRIERGHHTRRRDWDYDMGGDEWRDMFGLPDNWGGSDWGSSGGIGGNRGKGGRHRRSRPVRIPRAPRPPRRPRPPRIRFPSGGRRGGGGFKTGGGF